MERHDNTSLNYAKSNVLGEITEYYVLQLYLDKGYDESIKRDEYCKTHDLEIPQLDYFVEVKYDYKSRKTGNLFFEHRYKRRGEEWEDSGFKTSLAKYWYMSDGEHIWVFTLKQIKEWYDLGIYDDKPVYGEKNGTIGMVISGSTYESVGKKIKIPENEHAHHNNLKIIKNKMKDVNDVDVIRGFRKKYKEEFLEKNKNKIKKPPVIKPKNYGNK